MRQKMWLDFSAHDIRSIASNSILHILIFKLLFSLVGIPAAVEAVMEKHKQDFMAEPSLEDIVNVDVWARDAVDSMLPVINSKYFINL